MVKQTCRKTVYDLAFCSKVCRLTEGEACIASNAPGIDQCQPGLECLPLNQNKLKLGNVCQSTVSAYDDVSKDNQLISFYITFTLELWYGWYA